MKINFKKISAVATSVLLTGMTLGVAAAANYPAPFVQGSTANVAIVYGASSQDMVPAQSISDALAAKLPSGASAGPSGESYALEKTSTKWNLGNGAADVVSTTVTDNNLPTLLADGVFEDDDNDEFDFTQKISLYNLSYTMFDDDDYKEDTPTLGIAIASDAGILNYTLDFTDQPYLSDMETADLPILGRQYYVLDAVNSTTQAKLTLLDSAQKITLSEGESTTITVGGVSYDVAVAFIGETEAKFNINGKTTNALSEGETQRLSENAYVGVRDILYTAKDSGVSKVEFSIGQGKLVLETGQTVEINDDDVNGLQVTNISVSNDGKVQKIILNWNADEDAFITEDSSIVLPGFNNLKLSSEGIKWPAEESFEIANSGSDVIRLENFPLKDSVEDINLLFYNGTGFTVIGKDSTHILRTSNTSSLTFDTDTDDFFVASWTDGQDAESYLMKVTSISTNNGVNKTTFQYRKGGSWTDIQSDAEQGDTVSIGNVDLTVGAILDTPNTVAITAGSGVQFDRLFSKEGLRVLLPWNCATATACPTGAINLTAVPTTYSVSMTEEDKDGNIASGKTFSASLGISNSKVGVSDVVGESATFAEIGDSEVFKSYTYSALATEFLWDQGPTDQDTLKINYHGDESAAKVFLSEVGDLSTGSNALGNVLVKDSEVASVKSKNLIVVGGSCANEAAATILGGRYCGAQFTTSTGIGAGQFLIQAYGNTAVSDGVVVLVAGYDAADTVAAASYLNTQTVSTNAGTKLKGTSADKTVVTVA